LWRPSSSAWDSCAEFSARADAELAAGGRPEGDDLRMFARGRRRFADRLRALITEPILKRPED